MSFVKYLLTSCTKFAAFYLLSQVFGLYFGLLTPTESLSADGNQSRKWPKRQILFVIT